MQEPPKKIPKKIRQELIELVKPCLSNVAVEPLLSDIAEDIVENIHQYFWGKR